MEDPGDVQYTSLLNGVLFFATATLKGLKTNRAHPFPEVC